MVEEAIYDFLTEAIAAAEAGSALAQIELQDTFYRRIEGDVGVRIGDCEADLSPLPDAEAVEEFNARVTLVCYARIPKEDWEARAPYRNRVTMMARTIALLFFNDPRMGQRVNDARVLGVRRGYDSITQADRYAVANLDVIINELGQQIGG